MKRVSSMAFIALTLAATFALGCAENKAATEKCKGSGSSSDCESCCKSEGANGYKYISGKCGCLGG